PGIGPSRTLRQYFFAGNTSNSRGEPALDAGRLRLNLPTAEISPVVGQNEFEITHEKSNPAEYPCIKQYIVYSRLRESKRYSAILLDSHELRYGCSP